MAVSVVEWRQSVARDVYATTKRGQQWLRRGESISANLTWSQLFAIVSALCQKLHEISTIR